MKFNETLLSIIFMILLCKNYQKINFLSLFFFNDIKGELVQVLVEVINEFNEEEEE